MVCCLFVLYAITHYSFSPIIFFKSFSSIPNFLSLLIACLSSFVAVFCFISFSCSAIILSSFSFSFCEPLRYICNSLFSFSSWIFCFSSAVSFFVPIWGSVKPISANAFCRCSFCGFPSTWGSSETIRENSSLFPAASAIFNRRLRYGLFAIVFKY